MIIPDGTIGWVDTAYVEFNVELSMYNISGEMIVATPTPTTQSVANVDTSLSAADIAGVVTGITSRSRQIFLDGQAKGNLHNVFTRVGDSITRAGQFLTQIVPAVPCDHMDSWWLFAVD